MCWYLLHFGSWCTRSGVELVDEETGESVAFHQIHCLLEVFLGLTRKTADYICRDGYTWDPKREAKRLLGKTLVFLVVKTFLKMIGMSI